MSKERSAHSFVALFGSSGILLKELFRRILIYVHNDLSDLAITSLIDKSLRVHLHVCRKINTQARWDPTQALGRIFGQVIFYFLPRERCEYFLLNLTYSWEICSFHYLAHSPSLSGLFSNRLHQVLRLLTLTGTLPSAGNLKPILRACSSLFTHAKSATVNMNMYSWKLA